MYKNSFIIFTLLYVLFFVKTWGSVTGYIYSHDDVHAKCCDFLKSSGYKLQAVNKNENIEETRTIFAEKITNY